MRKLVVMVVFLVSGFLVVGVLPAAEAGQGASWAVPAVMGANAPSKPTVSTDTPPPPAKPAAPIMPGARSSASGDVEVLTKTGKTLRLSYRERRSMGMTRMVVRRTLREMKRDGFDAEDREELVYELQDRLVEKYPKAWENSARKNGVLSTEVDGKVMFDFEGFLAFLEGFLPLLLQILAIFGL